jgi:hypothetical protein
MCQFSYFVTELQTYKTYVITEMLITPKLQAT